MRRYRRLLAHALAHGDYDLAAHVLMLMTFWLMDNTPPDSLEGTLDIIAGRNHGRKHRRRKIVKKSFQGPERRFLRRNLE